MLQWMCRLTKRDTVRNEKIRETSKLDRPERKFKSRLRSGTKG